MDIIPDPPDEFFIAQGWKRGDGVWWKQNGEPVFFIDLISAYPPLKAWVEERTRCCRERSCSRKTQPKDER